MKILLDTHILLLTLTDDPPLPTDARKVIEDEDNELYYSIASLWEIQIKRSSLPQKGLCSTAEMCMYCSQSGIKLLPLRTHHITALEALKQDDNAFLLADDFDRILLSQAEAEKMMLLTDNPALGSFNYAATIV